MTTKAKLKLKFTKCNQITAFTFLTLQTSNTTVVSSTSTEEINITTRVNHFMKCKNIIPFNINTDLCWRERWREAAGPGPGPSQHSHSHPRHTGALTPRLRLRWSWQEVLLRPQLVTRVRPAYTPHPHPQPFIQSLIMCNPKKIILLFWPPFWCNVTCWLLSSPKDSDPFSSFQPSVSDLFQRMSIV